MNLADIPNYEKLYSVDLISKKVWCHPRKVKTGNGYRWTEGRFMKPIMKKGEMCVGLYKDKFRTFISISSLLTEDFAPSVCPCSHKASNPCPDEASLS